MAGTLAWALAAAVVALTPVSTSHGAERAVTLAPGVQLLPIRFAELPGWRTDDHAAAFAAFRRSCPAVGRRAAANPAPALTALAAVCARAMARGQRRIARTEARVFFERFFEPHRVVRAPPASLLTGYYEPHIAGSLVRTGRFDVPLFGRPADLENVVAEEARATSGVALTHMRRTADGLVPYATRAEIEAGALAGRGLEVVWLADPVEAFFAQVQGSARIILPDGRRIGLSYDGKNGHPYTSIGRVLVERGAMRLEDVSMASLAAYLRADPVRAREVMQRNESYVFFRRIEAAEDKGAHGALGVALTPGRSLAVDTAFHALGSPVWVDAPSLRHWGRRAPFRRLMVAHDVGSAIKGPERGDIYFGSGARAAARAGITRHPGSFAVFLPRGSIVVRAER